jgi:hypothetical protein
MSKNKGLTEEDLELLLNESGSDYVPSDIEEDGYSSESEGEILDLGEEVDVVQNSDNLPGPSTNQPGTSTHQNKGRNKQTNKEPKINISWKSDNNFTPKTCHLINSTRVSRTISNLMKILLNWTISKYFLMKIYFVL